MKKLSQNKTWMLSFVLVMALFQNCSGFKSSSQSSSSKTEVVSRKVFQPFATINDEYMGTVLANGGSDAGGTVLTLQDCLAAGECEANGTFYVLTPPMTFQQPVRYYCSDDWTGEATGNVVTSTTGLRVGFIDASNQIACEVAGMDIKQAVLNEKLIKATIPAGQCTNLTNGRYTMLVTDANKTLNTNTSIDIARRSLVIANDNHNKAVPLKVDITKDATGHLTVTPVGGKTPYILWKDNNKGTNAGCEETHSPLIVQMTPQPRKIRLSAPDAGVQFNILGWNDSPANTQRQISWFSSGDAVSHYFIALPDANGNVNGIDQLFGNNTLGPDGKYANNGYDALGKYDADHDGVISKKDPIYYQLRFWSDRNVNGVAEASEQYWLESLGVESIDLNYDPNYAEEDRFGNLIKMKSVVQTWDGQLFLMYDIWYRLRE
jgi:hypothetical protein